MDPEQTFLRVHARVSGMLSQLLTPRIRTVLEYIYLSVAIASFALLVVMHTNFVQQPGCSGELAGVEIAEAQLVQIKISSAGLWSQNSASAKNDLRDNQHMGHVPDHIRIPESRDGLAFAAFKLLSSWVSSGIKRNKRNFKMWKGDKEFLEHQLESAVSNGIMRTVSEDTRIEDHNGQNTKDQPIESLTTHKDTIKASIFHFYNIWYLRACSLWKSLEQLVRNAHQLWDMAEQNLHKDTLRSLGTFYLNQIDSFIAIMSFSVQWLERSSLANDPIYLYTTEKGYFLLPEGAKSRHNIHTVNVSISAGHSCFGNRWQQLLINRFVGYDTILMNSLLSAPGPGYLYNFQTKEFFHLSYGPEPIDGPAKFGDYFVTKCSVLLMSLFVFFTTTMSVSFTLRETQSRMLKFTVQLQHHARHHLPTFQLIFVHVIESLVFVPIMIGILFFLFEFYDDQLLAFLVLTLVWLCELFTMISVRTPISMQFFPRFFLLYFLIFHIYFFSYAYGFSYLAFSTTAAFMQHLILFFWNRYEVPALQRFMRNRSQLQQQTGVHITSSTILTSTLHIARVDVRSPGIIGHELTGVQPLSSDPNQAAESTRSEQLVRGDPASANGSVQLPQSDRQPDNTPSSSLNPFGSLLFGILGGASTDGLVSFFSMFRDLRDHDNVYVEPSQQEGNEHVS